MGDAAHPSLPDTVEEITAAIGATQAALVENLQDELVCAVCGCVFIDPRVLQCQHCFCLRCLYSTVARDRTQHLEVPCAYRCEEVTVTKGDIRTLPKNHYITNTCILLRKYLVRRAQLLEKKFTLLDSQSSPVPSPSTTVDVDEAASAPLATCVSGVVEEGRATLSRPVDQLLLKKERDLVAELYECEWCSCSSPSCEVCPYCWSRVCAECRGQFSDHQFLCVEPNQPGRRPPEGWIPGTSAAGVATSSLAMRDGDVSPTVPHATPIAEEENVFSALEHDAAFSFFFTPSFIPTLVKDCLVKQHHAPLQLSEIDVANVTPVRLRVPEVAVQCQHHTTGFTFDYVVHPTFATVDGVTIDINTPHWRGGDGKPSSTLSFLANATRLGETVLQNLHRLTTAASNVVLELSSAAHQAYVRRNKGFHIYALHVWALVRAQCQIARDAMLPHLERSRLLENITGDLVTYRFQQTMSRASPPQQHVIHDKCVAFLKTEIRLCRQLDQAMEGIDAACRGIYTLLGRMRDAMKELAQPKVHRGEEHTKSRQSRLHFSVQLFHTRQEEQHQQPQQPQHHQAEETADAGSSGAANGSEKTRVKAERVGGTTRSPSHATLPNDVSAGPALNDAAVLDGSFSGQLSEHHDTAQALTDSLISVLRCFMQGRVWEWSLSNTCCRECGLGDQDRRALLQAEETLQLLTDDLVKGVWSCSRLVYVLEVQQEEAGPASSLDILTDKETLALLDAGTDNPTYDHNEVFQGLKTLSQLRNHLLDVSSANVLAARSPDTQQELLNMMAFVLKTTMQQQTTSLRSVTAAEELYERRFAAYLRTRQMNPNAGDQPLLSEDTLLAVDVLKALQRHQEVLPTAVGECSGAALQHTLPRPSRPCETQTVSQALLADFLRRDTALLSCQRYGEALVRAANGHSLVEGRSLFDADNNVEAGGLAAADATTLPEERLPSPLSAVTNSATNQARPPPESVDGGNTPRITLTERRVCADDRDTVVAEEGTAQRPAVSPAASPSSASTFSPQGNAPSSLPASALRAVEVNAVTSHNSDGDPAPATAAATSTPALYPVHEELLFEADCADTAVETASVVLSLADDTGSRKAAKLFKTTFQLPATTTTVNQLRITYLPFYRGECTYKGVSATFYVDAQTGIVSVNPQLFSAGGRRQYMLELLSSPLFFILFNSTLSILLHKRYQLEIFFK